MSLWTELSQRNVFKVGATYAIVAWLLVQVASLIFPQLGLPDWTSTFVTLLLILGFPIALLLAWAYEVTPEGIKRTKHLPTGENPRQPTGRQPSFIVIGLLAIAVVFLALDSYWLRSNRGDGGADAGGTVRMAVLPCDNLSPDPNDSYFAPGIHEEVINRLAQIADIRVTSRSSVLQFAEQRPTIPEIAERLGVDTILECSVRYQQDQLVMTAQLIEGASDTHLWSQSYRADMSDLQEVFDVQFDMSVDIANEVSVALLDKGVEPDESMPTESREAYELYLAGVAATDFARSVELFREAVRIDPEFTRAWLAIASTQLSSIGGQYGAARQQTLASIRDALDRARAISPGSRELASSEAFYFAQTGEWIEAERQYQASLRLGAAVGDNPALAPFKYAVGHFAEGAEMSAVHIESNRLNSVAIGFWLAGLELTGNSDERRAQHARGEALFDNWWGDNIEMYLRLGDRDADYLRSAQFDGIERSRVWETAGSHIDTPADGRDAMRALYESGDESIRSPRELARLGAWAAYFGDAQLGLEAISDAAALQPNYVWFVWLSVFDSVRALPEFESLIDRMELPAYWEIYGFPDDCAWLAGTRFECS